MGHRVFRSWSWRSYDLLYVLQSLSLACGVQDTDVAVKITLLGLAMAALAAKVNDLDGTVVLGLVGLLQAIQKCYSESQVTV